MYLCKEGTKAMPTTTTDFLKGTLDNDGSSRKSLHQIPARKLNTKYDTDLAVDIPVEMTSLFQSEMARKATSEKQKPLF